jgi:PAS domain S-box-containing protein
LAASIAATDDAVIGWTLDTRITSWNPGAERLFGYTATEALGQSVRVLVPADYQPELSALIAQLRRGEPIDHREVVRLHKDGRRLDVVTSIAAFRASSGAVIGVSSVIRDITQQKRAERELQARARQQAVVAELGQRALAGADIQLLLDEAIWCPRQGCSCCAPAPAGHPSSSAAPPSPPTRPRRPARHWPPWGQ